MIRKNSWCVLDTWCVLGVAMMAFALCAVPAWADDADRAGEDRETKSEPAAAPGPEKAPVVVNLHDEGGLDEVETGWFLLLGRYGSGTTGGGGSFTFDNVPAGRDEETQFNLRGGRMTSGGVEAVFFPARGRQFLLSASALGENGFSSMNFEEDEYGRAAGLHNRLIHYDVSWLAAGIGYRWLTGDRRQNAWTLQTKVGVGGAEAEIDGVLYARGVSGLFELGGNWYHRFDNGLAAGVQLDLRGWGAEYPGAEFDTLRTEGDLSLGGGTLLVSFIVGWENL